MINLEPLAAKAARSMVIDSQAKDSFNLINKALMVLAEQGLFAFGLFLNSRKNDEERLAAQIDRAVKDLLVAARLADPPGAGVQIADYYRALTETRPTEQPAQALQRLILTKQVVETALTYGRYQAKSLI
ncbi:hypothetical protein [Candidatus Contendibacter odensensis]|uniref:CRISPR type III-B/RAMP module-associated protein Cmr5 n=1 Tax=Candidatus Contendobacter odensis Run_B_J11 TaxID=1400861 RepID=A0A7U7GAC6_9GAMM|nr:hypothetical protein [Candidatus Contendobacter odensis]CDH44674.1 hypothetical protein BN874_1810004 [Candidatus Contendobacter odensis Run_B_J11]